jgi:hypothetical protein
MHKSKRKAKNTSEVLESMVMGQLALSGEVRTTPSILEPLICFTIGNQQTE